MIRAAVLHAPGDIRVEEVPSPTATAGHALVRVAAVGVCGSDLPRILTKGAHRLPLIPGHEFSGVVVDAQPGSGVRAGDRVTVPPLVPCFECDPCRRGLFSLCRDYSYFGSRRDGAYAELVSVPASNLLVVPEGVDDEAAASVDPAAIALHALWRVDASARDRVAVVGAGPIGLFAIQWARILGAREVVAIDLIEAKLELARELGATATATPERADELGAGIDVVVETAGVSSAERQAVLLAGTRGRVVLVGIPTADVTLDPDAFAHLLREEITLHGAWNSFSDPFPGREWTLALEAMADGRLRTEPVISHRETLERLPAVIPWMGERRDFFSKVMFHPNGNGAA